MELSTKVQDEPEPSIEGNRFVVKQPLCIELYYVVVLADGESVAQQSFYKRGARWWVDDLFVAESHRRTGVIRVLRETTFRAVAEHADEFKSLIEYKVAEPERVLNDPIKRELGVKVELVRRMRSAAQYRYDVSALRPQAAATG